jgi:hypothetical protein
MGFVRGVVGENDCEQSSAAVGPENNIEFIHVYPSQIKFCQWYHLWGAGKHQIVEVNSLLPL